MRSIPLIGLFLLLPLQAMAQQEVSFAHYWAMEPSFNPATVGKEQQLRITGSGQMSMAGYKQHPRTVYLAADVPLPLRSTSHGVGIQVQNDKVGVFTDKRLAVQYAFQCRLFGGTLRLGVQAGMLNEGYKGSEAGDEVEDPIDPTLSDTDAHGTALDLGGGLYYQHGRWYAGLSVLHANVPTVAIDDHNDLRTARTTYFTAGYVLPLRNPQLALLPSVLAYSDGDTRRADTTVRLRYATDRRMLYGGVGYSPGHAVTVLIGGKIHGVHLGYSYAMYTSGTGLRNGSHELFVSYQTDLRFGEHQPSRHQSVRIL